MVRAVFLVATALVVGCTAEPTPTDSASTEPPPSDTADSPTTPPTSVTTGPESVCARAEAVAVAVQLEHGCPGDPQSVETGCLGLLDTAPDCLDLLVVYVECNEAIPLSGWQCTDTGSEVIDHSCDDELAAVQTCAAG